MDYGVVEGVDFSKAMVEIAKKKNLKNIKRGKVKIHLGDFDTMHFVEKSFDKIFTVNTIYFWKKPEITLSKICALLVPGGKLFIGLHEKSEMEQMPLNRDIFRYYSMQDLKELLSFSGSFADVEIISEKGKQKTCYCAVGTKIGE